MEERRELPSRIRCPRNCNDPAAFTAEAHRTHYLLAHNEPAYPPEAKAAGIEGRVLLDVVIGKDGGIESVSVGAGDPLLAEAAMQAVRGWTYRPAKLNGTPVEVATQVEVKFTLPEGSVVSS